VRYPRHNSHCSLNYRHSDPSLELSGRLTATAFSSLVLLHSQHATVAVFTTSWLLKRSLHRRRALSLAHPHSRYTKVHDTTLRSTPAPRRSNGRNLGVSQRHAPCLLRHSERDAEKHHCPHERAPRIRDEVRIPFATTMFDQIAKITTEKANTSGNLQNGSFAKTAQLSLGRSSVARSHCGRGKANECGPERWRGDFSRETQQKEVLCPLVGTRTRW
jgi:hypothetical protein